MRIIHELGLYPGLKEDAALGKVRKDILVDVINDHTEKHSIGAFKISYNATTPRLARDVTEKIANLFIEENLKVRDQQAQGTSRFIESETEKARTALALQEEKIREFKATHMGSLPEQENSNLALIGQKQNALGTITDAILAANRQKAYLQSMLNITGENAGATVPRSAAAMQLAKKREELDAAEQKYTDSHPDVIRLKAEVAALEQQALHAPKEGQVPATPTADMGQQMQSQLVSIEQEIKSDTLRQHEVLAELESLEGRIEVLPTVQSQSAGLNRDYQDLQANYQSLVGKQQSSAMAAELERHDEGEQFRILDPAYLPTRPSEPDLLLINGGGLLCSVILGLLLAVFAEMRDGTLHDGEELARYLGVPLIVALPNIPKLSAKELRALGSQPGGAG
jgi:polysaccharide chain length determinant protein (PEP-CTERM system associated)